MASLSRNSFLEGQYNVKAALDLLSDPFSGRIIYDFIKHHTISLPGHPPYLDRIKFEEDLPNSVTHKTEVTNALSKLLYENGGERLRKIMEIYEGPTSAPLSLSSSLDADQIVDHLLSIQNRRHFLMEELRGLEREQTSLLNELRRLKDDQ